jgi:lysophospholipase L1-like esterase
MKNLFNPFRRRFIAKASLGAAASLSLPGIVSAAYAETKADKISLAKDDVILFQGDSITDAGRKHNETNPNTSGALGGGYAFMAGSELLYKHANKNLRVYNKGISGNKVYQLAERWEADCLALKPNVLSVLIGVNDFWHTLTNNYTGTVDTYQKDLDALLEGTKKALPGVKLVIGEPFAVKGIKAVDDKWYPTFDAYRRAAKELAGRHGAAFIPYQTVFDKAQQKAPGVYWTYDGVHPSIAGSQLMAHAWLAMVK